MWIWDNFKDIFTTIGSFVESVFMGLVENIKNLWGALLSWFKGTGFNFNWTPLLKDFQSSIKNAPAFTSFVHSDLYNGLSKQLDETGKEWDKRAGQFQGAMDKAKPDKQKAKAVVDANLGVTAQDINSKTQGKGGGSFTGLTDFWKKAQEGVLKNDQKEALQHAKKTAINTEKAAKALEQIAKKPAVAMAG